MALLTLFFSGEGARLVSALSITSDTGETVELTKPGTATVEAESSFALSCKWTSNLTAGITTLEVTQYAEDGSTETLLYVGDMLIDIGEGVIKADVKPLIGLQTATAELNLLKGAVTETLKVKGYASNLDVVLPDNDNDPDKITLGYTKVWDKNQPGPWPSEVQHLPGESVSVPAKWGAFWIYQDWATLQITTPRNGVAPHLWYQGQMREAAPYVWQDGQWVELQSALEIQGYFELEE